MRWINQFLVKIYKWRILLFTQCMPTQKRSSVAIQPNRMQIHWCPSMKTQKYILVIANDLGTGSQFKFRTQSVFFTLSQSEPWKRALNRATLKKSRRLRRGLTLTEHINQRLRQNQRSAKQRNEFLPTGIYLKSSFRSIQCVQQSLNKPIGHRNDLRNIKKQWKTS